MKTLCLQLIALCLLVPASSCKQKTDFSKEITRLDSTQAILAKAKIELVTTVEPDSNAISFLSKTIDNLRSHQSSDTVDKKSGILLAELSNLKGMLIDLKLYKGNYLKAADEALERIKNLQHDLKENLIEDNNKAREYIVNETKALEKIVNELKLIKEVSSVSAHKLDSLKSRAAVVIDSLSSK